MPLKRQTSKQDDSTRGYEGCKFISNESILKCLKNTTHPPEVRNSLGDILHTTHVRLEGNVAVKPLTKDVKVISIITDTLLITPNTCYHSLLPHSIHSPKTAEHERCVT